MSASAGNASKYQAAGLDFARRGHLLDHTLDVCRTLWTEPVADHSSPHLVFSGIHMMPKPLQPGGVPIWVSGRINPRVVDRLCRNGLRWIPWGDDAIDLERSLPAMRDRIAAHGIAADGLQVVANLRVFTNDAGTIDVTRTLEPVPALVAAGATDFLARLRNREPDARTERPSASSSPASGSWSAGIRRCDAISALRSSRGRGVHGDAQVADRGPVATRAATASSWRIH